MAERLAFSPRTGAGPASGVRNFGRPLRRLVERLLDLDQAARDRRRLLEMDEHMLKDLGITRADAAAEAERMRRWMWSLTTPS